MIKRYKETNRYKSLIVTMLFGAVITLTIGYSLFSTDLNIGGIFSIVRIQKDIRITNISLNQTEGDALSNYEEYNVKNIYASIDLPNSNSFVVYKIDITNIGNVEMGISNITGLPNNLKYTIDANNYIMKDRLCDNTDSSLCKLGAVKSIYLKIEYDENGYDSQHTNYPINLNFDFKRVYTITYNGFLNTNSLPGYIMEDETKTITFNNTSFIPSEVFVVGTTSSYNSPTLTLSGANRNITVYRKYVINYVLNGGTQAANQPTSIAFLESVSLSDPTKEEYNFNGWYTDPDFEGNPVSTLYGVTQDITLYASWSQYDYYIRHKDFDGTVGNIIDTGIELYSAENVNKNFRIKFTIDSYDSSYPNTTIVNNQAPTILSSMNETGAPWPGFVYRVYNNSGTVYNLKINDSHVTSYNTFYPLASGIDVEIVRENGVMYTKINSNLYTRVLDYASSVDTFNVPLTIGGNINSQGNYDRLFKGSLSNVSVEFYEGSIVNIDHHEYSYTEIRTEDSYLLNGTIEFDGTNYIDTGINLFSAANINKDFEISLVLEQIGGNSSQATLINLKDESQNNVWPGVAYRIKSGNTFEFTARWPGQSNASVTDNVSPSKIIKISRRSGIIYYSVNNATEKKLISTPPASLTTPINCNLTFGASTNSGVPFRYVSAIVSNINVNLYDNNG
ncbi:MAG: InlB B-repeat-containing protein [Bacilli bacterium]|nr:InlB B-repeat-containing protein [Bacilli bacterium]